MTMRKTPLKRTRRKRRPTPEETAQDLAFHNAVANDNCGNCGLHPGCYFAVHHVIEKQELKKRKLPIHDPRNAMMLCWDCHERHHNGSRRVPFRKLRAENRAYAYEVLGDYASDYLRARYPMAEEK